MRLGRVAKLSDEEIAAASTDEWATSELFDEREKAAILWADRVTRNIAKSDTEAQNRVRRQFSEPELVELTMAICQFALLNRFNDSLWMDLDDGAPPGANLYIEQQAFQRYAAAMYR